jgi:hypothetical protein
MEKTYIITESELQALLEKQREICASASVLWIPSQIIGERVKRMLYKVRHPDLSHLKEAGKELEELRAWKESAMKVMPDFQEIGKLLNIPLGTSVSEQIIPKIKELKEAHENNS